MNNNSIDRDIRNTIRDASTVENGAPNAADALMQDVNNASEKYGPGSAAFSKYLHGVTAGLTEQGLMPELALGFAKNNYQDLDVDNKDGISKVELFMANERANNVLEKQLTATLLDGFREVRSAHESNKFVPFAKDAGGITEDDLDAKMKEATHMRDSIRDHREDSKEELFLETTIKDLNANGGRLFNKLARGDRDGARSIIDKDDLEDILERDDKARQHGSQELTDKERKQTQYLLNNWDSEQVMFVRADLHSWDSNGNEFVHEGFGDITRNSAARALSAITDNAPQPASDPKPTITEVKPKAAPQAEVKPVPQEVKPISPPPQARAEVKPYEPPLAPPVVTEPCENKAPRGQQPEPRAINPIPQQPAASADYGYRAGQRPYASETPYDTFYSHQQPMPRPRPITPRTVGYEREIDQSSQIYSGGGLTLGSNNYHMRESAGGRRPVDVGPPPDTISGVTSFLNGLSQLNGLAAPWLAWDAQKQANRHGINPYGRVNPYNYVRPNPYRPW